MNTVQNKNIKVSVQQNSLLLRGFPKTVSSIDILFDGKRFWSPDIRQFSKSEVLLNWPESVQPYLDGQTELTILDSATRQELIKEEVRFSENPARILIANSQGIPLAVNKWGRLAPDLVSLGDSVQKLILQKTDELCKILHDLNLRPFLVGGTLLGAVRDGALLPHDDDADIAYLSTYTNSADIAVEGYETGRKLEDLGYELMRHSATHMQIHFFDEELAVKYYVDIFAAFFTNDGNINQPFHVRGQMTHDQMLPFKEVNLGKHKFDIPRDYERWLTINYDSEWRTPIPGFVIDTPVETRRRFENWFGSFNFNRHYWNEFYAEPTFSQSDEYKIWRDNEKHLLSFEHLLKSKHVIEIGAGDGSVAKALLNGNRYCVVTDYAKEAINRANENFKNDHYQSMHLNLYRVNVLAAAQKLKISGSFDVVAHHVLETVGAEARSNALLLIRYALRRGGSALAMFNSKTSAIFHHDDPATWHLPLKQLQRECRALGIDIKTLFDSKDTRGSVVVMFSLQQQPNVIEKTQLKIKVKQLLKWIYYRNMKIREVSSLRLEVAEIQKELDTRRSQISTLAQILDITKDV